MSLNLILGKSNTGKSEYIINKIMACEKKGKQAILFVPSTMKVVTEEEYLKYTKKKAIIDTQITSIERYVSKHIDKAKLYNNKTFLPDMAKNFLVRRVIEENPDMFKIFGKVKDKTGFVQKLEEYLTKFKEIDLEDLQKRYNEEGFLKLKLDEFINITNKLKEKLKERFVTSIDELHYYLECINSDNQKIDAEVYIDGYNNFNNSEFLFIKSMLRKVDNIYITLNIDKEKYENEVTSIFNTTYNTFSLLKKMCEEEGINLNITNFTNSKNNKNEALEYLSNNIFCTTSGKFNKETDNINLVLLPNINEEIRYVAQDILKHAINGIKYEDIAIYTNSIDTYYNGIKKIFEVYNIPVYINSKDKITDNNLVVFLIKLFEIACKGLGKSIQDVLVLIKTGILNIDLKDAFLFENYLIEYGIKGYNLNNPFKLNENYDIEKLNNIREYILLEIKKFKQCVDKRASKEITEGIYNYLTSNNIISKYEKQIDEIKEIDVDEYNKKVQVIGKIYSVMDSINLAFDEITKEEYLNLLTFGIKSIVTQTIPAKKNEVEVLDINISRGKEKKIGYIIGCYDTGLPMSKEEDSIFSDSELEKLKNLGIDLKETCEERNNMQLFNIYEAINKVREKITFSLPASNNSGSSNRESSIISEIKMKLDIKLESVDIKDSYSEREGFKALLKDLSKLQDEDVSKEKLQELLDGVEYFKNKEKYNEVISYLRKDENLKRKTTDKIYKKNINSSVSKLEEYSRCPFAYYSKYVLKLREKKKFEISLLDSGAFLHEVIEKFSKYLVSRDISWQSIVTDEKVSIIAQEKLNQIVDELFKKEYEKYLTEARYVIYKNKLKKVVTRTIYAISDSFNHSEFRPLGYEIEFSQDSIFAPIEVDLENGNKFLLKGKIDRIDYLDEGNNTYLRIVDYKSSDKNLKLSDIKSGISLQLMTYMWAMMNNKDKINKENNIVPAALSYFTISKNILNIPTFEESDYEIKAQIKKALKLRGIYISDVEILKKLDNNYKESKESYLEVSSRSMNNLEKVLPEDKFKEECNNMGKILKKIGKEIVQGNVKIAPNRDIKNVCEYCPYYSICRKSIIN